MNNKNQNKDEIDLLELFYALLEHWKLIIASTLLVGACAFLISSYLITPQYKSTSVLYVLSKSTSITSLADIQMGASLTNDYVEVVKSRPIIEQVIANLKLEGQTYKSLYEKIEITNPSNTRLLKITVCDPDPLVAKQIADELANVSRKFIAQKMDQAPPTITQYGYADGEPASPNIGKNTIIGLLLGALIAIGAVTISFLMNDTVNSSDDVEKLGLVMLGSIPEDENENDGSDSKRTKIRHKKKPETGGAKYKSVYNSDGKTQSKLAVAKANSKTVSKSASNKMDDIKPIDVNNIKDK
ncbi:MAG: YveK family protein [Wujia sp.]